MTQRAPATSAPTSPRFAGRTAIVTGTASGFGCAIARLLAAGGGRIVGVDRNGPALQELVAGLPPVATGPHCAIVADLRPSGSPAAVADQAWREAGPIDILVNSAGVCRFSRVADISAPEWDEVIETDVRSLFQLSVAVAERMEPGRGGRIINLGSNAGRKGRALSAHYAAAKAAVANLTESLALAYGPKNITVNTVCPAVVLTPLWDGAFAELGAITGKQPQDLIASWQALTPLRRLGTVDDVARLVAFLASDDAAFITGQAINVCGGFMLTC